MLLGLHDLVGESAYGNEFNSAVPEAARELLLGGKGSSYGKEGNDRVRLHVS